MFDVARPEGVAGPCVSVDVVKGFLSRMQEVYAFVDNISDDPDVDFLAVFDEVTEELSWPHFFGIEPSVGKVNPKVLQPDEFELLNSRVDGTIGRFQHGDNVHQRGGVWEYAGVEVDGVTYELSATNACVSYYKDLEDYCALRFRKLGEGCAINLGIVGESHVDEPIGKVVAAIEKSTRLNGEALPACEDSLEPLSLNRLPVVLLERPRPSEEPVFRFAKPPLI